MLVGSKLFFMFDVYEPQNTLIHIGLSFLEEAYALGDAYWSCFLSSSFSFFHLLL